MSDIKTIGLGFFWDDLPVGTRFRTVGRTIADADLAAFVNLTWLIEELFTNAHHREEMALPGKVVPGAMVYAFAEGLLTPSMQDTGLAFLNAEIDIKGPTLVGDTIHVECEVIEARPAAKGKRGLVRTRNNVVKQDGTVVLTYNPLRLMKGRPPEPSA